MNMNDVPPGECVKAGTKVYVPELRAWARLTSDLHNYGAGDDMLVSVRWFTDTGFVQYATLTIGEVELREGRPDSEVTFPRSGMPLIEQNRPSIRSEALEVLQEAYTVCLSGDFYADYDEATRLLGRMRAALKEGK